MPRTMIQRLAKGVLPANTQLQRDAVTALCKSATVFVSHVAAASSDEAARLSRRTVAPEHVFAALRETEHAGMIPRLERELSKWVEVNTSKRNEYRRKMKETKDSKTEGHGEDGEGEGGEKGEREEIKDGDDAGGERAAKRVKGLDGTAARNEDDTMEVDEEEGEGDEPEEEEGEDEEDDDDEDEDEGEGEGNEEEMDPVAAQLERESRAVNIEESEDESD